MAQEKHRTHHTVGGVDVGGGKFGRAEIWKAIIYNQLPPESDEIKALRDLRDDALTLISPSKDMAEVQRVRAQLQMTRRNFGRNRISEWKP